MIAAGESSPEQRSLGLGDGGSGERTNDDPGENAPIIPR